MSALSTEGLTKSFRGLRVINGVSLSVEPGERRLIIGPNGAGKTTLFNLITGEIPPDAGTVSLYDRDITAMPVHKRPHAGMTRTYQIITLFSDDALERNISLALLALKPWRWHPFARLDANAELKRRALETLDRLGLSHLADRPLSQTSYGEQRRVEIGMALAQDPRIILLDEPFAGLSAEERMRVRALLDSIPRDVTIIMIDHDMDVALDFAERVTVLHFGEVIAEGSRAEVVADPRTREIYLGE